MSNDKRRPDRLQALERWRSSELDEARIKMVELDAVASEKHAAVERIEAAIVSVLALAREQASGTAPMQPESLLRMSAFNNYQRQQLEGALDSYRESAQQADVAQRTVRQLFEQLSVVQRLQDRRRELAGKQELRSLQKRLDEGALTRAPHTRHETTEVEDTTHGR